MLKINLNNVRYNDENILIDNVCLNFGVDEINCIIGRNGSGKTTLLNVISRFIPEITNGYFEGEVKYNNKKMSFENIDYVFQNSENSLFFNKVSDQLSTVDSEDMRYWLNQFDIHEKYNSLIKELSVGQRKIVSCISALLSKRPICFLDEPSTNLDDQNKKILIQLIKKTKTNKIILMVSHDKDFINISDNCYKIENRKIEKINNNITIQKNKSKIKTDIKNEMLLRLQGFSYTFDSDITYSNEKIIEIGKGNIVGCIGKNGCGKTTLANYILKNYKKFYKQGFTSKQITCAVMFQDFYKQLFQFSVEKEIIFGCNKKESLYKVDAILKRIGLFDKKQEDPRLLSDGQKRILLVASLLMKKVDLLILDEPFDNIDEESKKIIKELLTDFIKNGSTIIILDQNTDDFNDIINQLIDLDIKPKSDKQYEEELNNKGFKYLGEGLIHNVYEKNNYIYKIVKSNLPLFNVDNHFNKEFKCHSFLRENGIQNVAEISEVHFKNEMIKDYSVLVEKKIPGKCYKNDEISTKNIDKIIGFLVDVSTIDVLDYGVIFDENVNGNNSWNDYIDEQIKIASKILRKYFSNKSKIKKLIKCKENFVYTESSKFLIMDPNTENFIFNSNGFVAIDIDHPIGGDPLWQMACIYWYKPHWKEINSFREIFSLNEEQILKYCILFGLNVFDFFEKNNIPIKTKDLNRIDELYWEVVNIAK